MSAMHTAKMTDMAKMMPSRTAGSVIQCRMKMDPVGRAQATATEMSLAIWATVSVL